MTAGEESWRATPAVLALASGDVHVWRASLDLPVSYVEQLAETLSPDERSRAARFRFQQDQTRFVAGRGLLRTILGRYLGAEPSRLRFCYGHQGKPVLARAFYGASLRFNLSHSHGLALYAVAREREVGVDLERVSAIPEAGAIVERFFSAREKTAFRALDPPGQREAFFRWWTRKEAYVKASGEAVFGALDWVEGSQTPGGPLAPALTLETRTALSQWVIHDLCPGSRHVAALAVQGHAFHLVCWQWSQVAGSALRAPQDKSGERSPSGPARRICQNEGWG